MSHSHFLISGSPPVKKPAADYHMIMDSLIRNAKFINSPRNKKLAFTRSGNPVCYLLFEGRGEIYRSHDNLIVSGVRAPNIIGLTNILYPLREEYHWRPESDCVVMVIDADMARKIIEEKNLWQHLAIAFAYTAFHLGEYNSRVAVRSGLNVICQQIHAYMSEGIEVKMKTSLSTYILKRTLLSKSYVMKIIAELKSNNRLIFKDKLLIEIDSDFITSHKN